MRQFTSIEKLDTGILYLLELASSLSVLFLLNPVHRVRRLRLIDRCCKPSSVPPEENACETTCGEERKTRWIVISTDLSWKRKKDDPHGRE